MTPAQLKSWRSACSLTQKAAADALDVSVDYYRDMETTGRKPINKRTRLACWAVLQNVKDYHGPE